MRDDTPVPSLQRKMHMNVLFVYTNIDGFHFDNYHFGLGSLVSVTKNADHETKVLVLTEADHILEYKDELQAFQPDVVGFSSVSSQYVFIKKLAKMTKEFSSDIITVCGGVHPTLSADSLLECDSLDGLFRGESELSFVEFLGRIQSGQDYSGTENFAYVADGQVVSNPMKPLIQDLDILPDPDKDTYPYHASSIVTTGAAPFFFTRGCPFTCTYCFNQHFADLYDRKRNFPRFRSAEKCIQEIERVMEKYHEDIRYVFIGDDIFGPNDAWRNEFCSKYKERVLGKYKKRFMILMRVEMCQKVDLPRLLKDSGCFRVFFGVESGDERQRKEVLDRRMSDDPIIRAFDLVRSVGLETLAVNIIGFPEETEDMIKKTVDLNRRLKPTISGVNIFYPYRGTELGDRCFQERLVDLEKFETFSKERRESVLSFPEEHHGMLMHYYQNWSRLRGVWNTER